MIDSVNTSKLSVEPGHTQSGYTTASSRDFENED